MQKILICFNSFQLGGVASSLFNLFRNLPKEMNIDLLCFSHEGPLREQLPSNVHLLKTNKLLSLLGDSQKLTMKKSKILGLLRAFCVVYSKMFGSTFLKRLLFKKYGRLDEYDVAISFSHDLNHHIFCGGGNRYIAEFTNAPIKITFIHCDFEHYGGNCKLERLYYSKFDKIACCSKGAKEVFDRICPDLKDKTQVVYNCIDYGKIEVGKYEIVENFDKSIINIVTVCRLSIEKGIDRGLTAMAQIKKLHPNLDFHWHIIGDGPQKDEFLELTSRLNLDGIVTFYGEKVNPYPYMKQASFFFLPSYHECAPIVFNESLYLGVPVVATKTVSVNEMLIMPKAGYVCENSIEGLFEGLEYVLTNPKVLLKYKDAISNMEISNVLGVKQFLNLLR